MLVVFLSEGHVYQILALQRQVEQQLEKVKCILNDISSPELEDESNENDMVIEHVYCTIKQCSISHACMMNFTKELAGFQIIFLLGSWTTITIFTLVCGILVWNLHGY